MTEKPRTGHLANAWINIDKGADPGFFVRFLDASRVRALAFARSNPDAAFAHLALKSGMTILDCGCGTGDMLALMARLTAPGKASGGDLSAAMIQEAKTRSSSSGVTNVDFNVMDVQKIPFPDQSFDRVLATQLLIHVPDPHKAFREMCRVTAPMGRVALSDMDWDGLLVGCSNLEIGRRFTRLFSDGIRNPVVVREFAGWFKAEGFVNIRTIPVPLVFDDWAFFREWMIAPSLPHFIAQGAMSREEAEFFVADLESRNAAGKFLAACTLYTVVADRP